MKKFSWRDEFGIFFDSAERHDSQRLAHSRAGEATWFANLLHDINRGGSGLCHGKLGCGNDNARRRSRIPLALGAYDFGVGSLPHLGESIFAEERAG